MPLNAFSFVEMYRRVLDTTAHLLDKGAAHATASGVGAAEMLDWRLIGDMHPLRFQVVVICNFTRQWPARFAGRPVPDALGAELSLDELRAGIADAKAYLAGLTPEAVEGRDDTPLKVALGNGMEPTLPAGQWLSGFATTNVYFHLSMAYAILRARGVPLGKVDMFAGGL